jgi:hypothetical protein
MRTRSDIRRLVPRLLGGAIALSVAPAAIAADATGCAPGTRCIAVNTDGSPGTGFTAQCSGQFPDFVVPSSMIPSGFAGPWFKLAQKFPARAKPGDAPWLKIDFRTGQKGANDYLYALRDYSFEGMIEADFQPEKNTVRQWVHMPMMNFGKGRREPMRGLTQERQVTGPELGVKPNVTINNYAVGFYNQPGGVSIGQVWKTNVPDIAKSRFPNGTMTFKILFSDGTANDFSGPDPMAGAPEFNILTTSGPKTVRLLQMDVSAVDARALSGWVFGTFSYQPSATDPSPWRRLRPVGLSWGNDPTYTPADQAAGKKLKQTTISEQIPDYAAGHLGWAGRTNGPVDNPISGCLSCHGTAQYPVAADMAPFNAACDTDAEKLYWFRNFKSPRPFGAMNKATCAPTTLNPPPRSLDFSLQMQVAVQAALQFNDQNPCTPSPAPPATAAKSAPPMGMAAKKPLAPALETAAPYAQAPRIER